jgi:hypothetical protein
LSNNSNRIRRIRDRLERGLPQRPEDEEFIDYDWAFGPRIHPHLDPDNLFNKDLTQLDPELDRMLDDIWDEVATEEEAKRQQSQRNPNTND